MSKLQSDVAEVRDRILARFTDPTERDGVMAMVDAMTTVYEHFSSVSRKKPELAHANVMLMFLAALELQAQAVALIAKAPISEAKKLAAGYEAKRREDFRAAAQKAVQSVAEQFGTKVELHTIVADSPEGAAEMVQKLALDAINELKGG